MMATFMQTDQNNKKIKILFLVEYLYQGGIERLLEQFAKCLDKDKFEIHFFAYEMEKAEGMSQEIMDMGHSVTLYKKSNGYDFSLLKVLLKYIKEENINILHTHDFGPMEYAIALKLFNFKLKLVHTQHTVHHFVVNLKYVLFFQFASLFYRYIFSVSTFVDDVLKKAFRFVQHNMQVIFNGIDVDEFSKCQKSISTVSTLKLISIARASEEKNLLHILKACKHLKDKNVHFHYDHVGSGPELETLKEYVKDNEMDNEITFHGFQRDVQHILKNADVFLSASITEGHPLAVLEAMAARKTCLVSDIEAHKLFTQESVVFYKLDEPKILADSIEDIIENYSKYLSFGVNAEKEVRSKYSLKLMIASYSEIYKNEK